MFKRSLKANVLSLKLMFITSSGWSDASDNFLLCFCIVLATSPNGQRPTRKICYPKS